MELECCSVRELLAGLFALLDRAYGDRKAFIPDPDGQDVVPGEDARTSLTLCKRFEVWVADLPTVKKSRVIHGRRPVIVVSNDDGDACRSVVSVVPLTSQLEYRHQPTHVLVLGCGLRRTSRALCEQILSIDRSCLRRRIGRVDDSFTRLAIRHALALQLGTAGSSAYGV